MISLSSDCPYLDKLIDELSTPKRDYGADGRVKVESKKDLAKREVPSPNLADALVMACTWLGASVEHWGTNQTRQGYNTEQEEQHAINDDIGSVGVVVVGVVGTVVPVGTVEGSEVSTVEVPSVAPVGAR